MVPAQPAPGHSTDPLVPSTGVRLAPLGPGAVACDLVYETTHLLDSTAAWLLASALSGPVTATDLIAEASAATSNDPDVIARDLTRLIDHLTDLGLLGRTQPWEPPSPQPGSALDRQEVPQGAVHPVIDHRIAFRSTSPELLAEVDDFLGMGLADTEPTLVFDIETGADGGITITTADEWRFPAPSTLYAQLPGVINEYAARSHSCVVLHAGAVRTPSGSILLFPGVIDAGKSTLVAALIQAGCDYLGDESIGLRSPTLEAVGYPKPLTLDNGSRRVLGLPEDSEPHLAVDRLRPDVVRLWGEVGTVDHIVLPTYDGPLPANPDAPLHPPRVEALDLHGALALLLANTLNLARAGTEGLETLCRVAETVPAVRVTHTDSLEVARALMDGTLLA